MAGVGVVSGSGVVGSGWLAVVEGVALGLGGGVTTGRWSGGSGAQVWGVWSCELGVVGVGHKVRGV